jgi:hypothetical protein
MAAGRQPGRCPNVEGALRAAIEREAGGSLPPRHFVALQFSHVRSRSLGTHSTSRQEPLVLSRGDWRRRVRSDLSDLSDLSDGFLGCRRGRRLGSRGPAVATTVGRSASAFAEPTARHDGGQAASAPGRCCRRGPRISGHASHLVSHLILQLVGARPIRVDSPARIACGCKRCRRASFVGSSLLSALCSLLSALCSPLSALCSLLSALRSLLSALCSPLSADVPASSINGPARESCV